MPILIFAGLAAAAGFWSRDKLDSAFDFFSFSDDVENPVTQANSGFFSNPWALALTGLAVGMIINEVID